MFVTSSVTCTSLAKAMSQDGIDWARQGKYLASGAFAGAISRTATAPLERIKILKQVSTFFMRSSKA